MTATFVGMPPFPEAAHAALEDTQLRHNLAHATTTIRDKRARVVAEVEDWEELRVAGAAIKDIEMHGMVYVFFGLDVLLALLILLSFGRRDRRPVRRRGSPAAR